MVILAITTQPEIPSIIDLLQECYDTIDLFKVVIDFSKSNKEWEEQTWFWYVWLTDSYQNCFHPIGTAKLLKKEQ